MAGNETAYHVYFTDADHWPSLASGQAEACRFTEKQGHWTTAKNMRPGARFVAYSRDVKRLCGVLEVTGKAWRDEDTMYPVKVPVHPIVTLSIGNAVALLDDETLRILMRGKNVPRSQGWIAKAGLRRDMGRLAPGVGAELQALLERKALSCKQKTPEFDPTEVKDLRTWMDKRVKERLGQDEFRSALMEAYGRRCAVSGCDVPEALEAAHINPHLGAGTQVAANGLLLRADIHALFDCGLVTIDPGTNLVVIAASLMASMYAEFHARPLASSLDPNAVPSAKALHVHFVAATGGAADNFRT